MTLISRQCQSCSNHIPITSSNRRKYCDDCIREKHILGGKLGSKHTHLQVRVLNKVIKDLQHQLQQLTKEVIVVKSQLATVEAIVIKENQLDRI